MSEKAIDVFERYQGPIDWRRVYAAGVTKAFVKLTNGAAVASPAGDHYISGGRAAGLGMGGYAYALGGDPVAEANAFANELLRLGALDLPPALDYEDSSLPMGPPAQDWIRRFYAQLKARIPALASVELYGSGSVLQAMRAWEITSPGLTILDWDAEYGPNDGSEHPVRYYTGPVSIHQYSSVGHVDGIAGNVDLDTIGNVGGSTPATPSAPSVSPGVPSGPVNSEDSQMLVKPAVDDFVEIPANGHSALYIATGYGRSVTAISVDFIGATPPGGGASYLGHANLTFNGDRPGPIAIPAGTAVVSLRYKADHEFTARTA